MKSERFDIHQHITDQIIAAIESGAGEFRLPWHRSAGNIMRPINIASKNAYRGVNILTLWATADEQGYSSGTWGTYKQWSEAGAQVRKGEKAAYIVFYKEITVASEASDEAETRAFRPRDARLRRRAGRRLSGSRHRHRPQRSSRRSSRPRLSSPGRVRSVIHGGSRAFYRPSTDSIQLPPREAFIGSPTSTAAESYSSTLLA